MILRSGLSLRASVTLLLLGTVLVTLAIVGSGILLATLARIEQESQKHVTQAAAEMLERVEASLEDVEARVSLAGTASKNLPVEALTRVLAQARRPTLHAIYVIDARGKLVAASVAGSSAARVSELTGIDLSKYPFFTAAMESGIAKWSDKHISAVTGEVTLGLAVPIQGGAGVVIAELPQSTLLKISQVVQGAGDLDYWIVDSKGEVVVDTNPAQGEKVNVYSMPIVFAGLRGEPLPQTLTFGGRRYQASASYSDSLGWLVVSRTPAGLENRRVRETVGIVFITLVGSVLVGLLLAPLWAQGIVAPLRAVAGRAHDIANGAMPAIWPRGRITELNRLSDDLATMAGAIQRREEELRRINEELEDRVEQRTMDLARSNEELNVALTTIEQAKDELIQSEKLAALGRLVAGVAHELNTPLGNGRMAITTLADKQVRFEKSLAEGLRRSELDAFIQGVQTSTDIAERNLVRASRLIASFKQVAADRTASRRRKFRLLEVVDEVVLTVSPSMKHRAIRTRVAIPDDIQLDSYPGELGQVLTNLIENCVTHAFVGRDKGSIEIAAGVTLQGQVTITLRDDGVGMEPEVARRAFDPFFTTSLGSGGTGLGLFIAHNAVTNVLGGSISLRSQPGEGARFDLRLPLVAPEVEVGQDAPCAAEPLARPGGSSR